MKRRDEKSRVAMSSGTPMPPRIMCVFNEKGIVQCI
jgi:hypothetical protein